MTCTIKNLMRAAVACAGLLLSPWASALQVPGPVVDGEWLAKNRAEVTLLDVRPNQKSFVATPQFEVDKKTGKKFLVELGGHIADAVPVDNKKVRVERVINGLKLSGMIPERADFEALVRSWGAQAGRPIVLVSAGMEPIDFNDAARLYWQFKVYGEDNIAVLNGGSAGWIAEGREVSSASAKVVEGNWRAQADRSAELLATSEDVARAISAQPQLQTQAQTQLIDARDNATFLGLSKPGSVSAYGHLPGAKNVPTTLMSSQGGEAARLMSSATYRDVFKMSGADPSAATIAYCNTGHQASGTWFILSEVLGNKQTKLYDGSMHQWALEKRVMESVAGSK